MSSDHEDATAICSDVCGAACCAGGAFLRSADADRLAAAGFEGALDRDRCQTKTDSDGDCQLLDANRQCGAYDQRPLDCRLFPLGFVVDDEAERVSVVIVDCPLVEALSEATIAEYVERARSLLDQFGAAELRQYDALEFTASYRELDRVSFAALEVDL